MLAVLAEVSQRIPQEFRRVLQSLRGKLVPATHIEGGLKATSPRRLTQGIGQTRNKKKDSGATKKVGAVDLQSGGKY